MSALRVLLVHGGAADGDRWASALVDANHFVLPAEGLEQASEALDVQKFDAVVLGPRLPTDGIAEFTTKLRELERRQRGAMRTPVLSLASAGTADAGSALRPAEVGVDGLLEASFGAEAFLQAVASLAKAVSSGGDMSNGSGAQPVLDVEGFRAQVAGDEELLVEIIDLFLEEGPAQIEEMREALELGELQRVSRLAHTVKGSLGALHAERARAAAQDVELQAKDEPNEIVRQLVTKLEQETEALKPALAELRKSAMRR